MPQPFKGILPAISLDAIQSRPKFAAHIGTVISLWSIIEMQLGVLFAHMLKTEASLGVIMYMSLHAEAARKAT